MARISCPFCGNGEALISDGRFVHRNCSANMSGEEAAEAYISKYSQGKSNYDDPSNCDICGQEAVVSYEDGYLCFSCGTTYGRTSTCPKCGRPYSNAGLPFCNECWTNMNSGK